MAKAADYVACGLALVPIPTGQKGPSSRGWQRAENAIIDPQRATALRGNIGLAHAYSTPRTMALDIDDLQKARKWLNERGVDLGALLEADDALQIVSGRKGRGKLLYRLPPGGAPFQTKQISDAETGEMVLEFRCAARDGLTVQDILPPSIHPVTGQPYRWGGKGHWRAIPVIPDDLLTVWRVELEKKATRPRRKGRLSLFKGVSDSPRQRAAVADMLRHVSADCSYERYRDMVWAILSLGWPDAEAIAEQWCRTAPHRFDERSFQNLVASYDETRTPTIGTIHHHAAVGGWNG